MHHGLTGVKLVYEGAEARQRAETLAQAGLEAVRKSAKRLRLQIDVAS